MAVVSINITDVNDNSPVMSKSEYSVSIPENLAKNQTVLWVHASDADEVCFIMLHGSKGSSLTGTSCSVHVFKQC